MSAWFGTAERATAPHNRWDLLPAPPTSPPRVSVVVPWFRQQAELERLLVGIELQAGPVDIREVVVADDGSPEPPRVPSGYDGPPVVVVRQPDRGVRPGAARNLGAAEASGDVLVFLDADMVPSPGYVTAAASVPAVAPEALAVGTREHWDLEGWSAERTRAWLSGGPTPVRLEDPAWLAEGYRRSQDLVYLDRRSYQLVIGAVTTIHRDLFEELGGFDAGIDAYGAEDWDLAHRAVQAGCLLAHVDAVAHHAGPDWRGRVGPDGVKNPERLRLVERIPSRDDAVLGSPPFVRVTIHAGGADADACTASVVSVLASSGLSAAVGVVGAPGPCPTALASDPRVHWGVEAPEDPRTLVDVVLHVPIRVGDHTIDLVCDTLVPGGPGRVVVADADGEVLVGEERRARRRYERWAGTPGAPSWEELFGMPRCWPIRALGGRRPLPVTDLAEVFPR